MSIIDKVIAAVMPPESDEDLREARVKANAAAMPGDWLDQILTHHLEIERAFGQVKAALDTSSRIAALKRLATVLAGHANAEESVIYPMLADGGDKAHAAMGYDEQAMVKIQMAMLEKLDPMGQDFVDKLAHIQGAVGHHMYAEESSWLLTLKGKAPLIDQARMTKRYSEEYARYVGSDTLS